MSLANMFLEAKAQAQRTHTDRPLNLKGGARLVVRVQGDIVTLTIARAKKRVGTTELITFKRDCGVPESAIRFPQEGQRIVAREDGQWHSISYRWRAEEGET